VLLYSPGVVIALAVLSGPVPKLGVVAVALLAGGALVAREDRMRAFAIIGALLISPPLLLASIWHSPKIAFLHHHPLVAIAGGIGAVALVAAVAVLFDRWPALIGALAILALPFRLPISTSSGTSNLLIPLYVVVGAGSLAFVVRALRRRPIFGGGSIRPPSWLERVLALYLVIYALQATYSPSVGFQHAVQNMAFFYVPFTLLYCVLIRLEWTPELLRRCLKLIALVAVACAVFGFFEYATRHTYFSSKLAQQNQLYVYFVVNSVFYDPNIFGRFLALAMVALAVVLLYERPARDQAVVTGALAVLFAALVLSFSRSSMVAVLGGLAVLAANKWRPTRALVPAVVVVLLGASAVAAFPTTFGLNQGLNGVSAGRGSVLSGGIELFGDRPLWGFGSGSFETEYQSHHHHTGSLTASHTTPVTIGAEQGVIGELVYLALVLLAIVGLLRGSRADPARAAVAAAFAALLTHTMLYADFLEDPFTWALLSVGMALARAADAAHAVEQLPTGRVAIVPA
jgi:O-antigen ligase